MKDELGAILKAAAAHGQEHVLRWFDELSLTERRALLAQLEDIDWKQVDQFRKLLSAGGKPVIAKDTQPAEVQSVQPGSERWKHAREVGRGLLREGKVAVVTVAGGQGTRLGFDGPKGAFAVTPVRKKTLFQLHSEKLRALAGQFGHAIPWYIMTSDTNDAPTREFFAEHKYFGLSESDVKFFTQSMVPALDQQGRLVMESRGRLFMAPNGHGGTLDALVKSGMLKDMESRSVEEIFYFQVDNVLMKVADPVYMGLHHDAGAQMSCKVLMKRDPYEKLGLVVRAGKKVEVIEYSDLPEEMALERDAEGRLRFAAGSVAIHVFRVDFVKRVVAQGTGLPWHLAHKKVPTVDDKGNAVAPKEPNAYKFERFIFDALPMAESIILMEGNRADDFAPVKQASGEDSPESAARAMVEQAARWLESAGVKVPRGPDGQSRYPLEISPLLALEEEDLLGKVAKNMVINGPVYLGPEK